MVTASPFETPPTNLLVNFLFPQVCIRGYYSNPPLRSARGPSQAQVSTPVVRISFNRSIHEMFKPRRRDPTFLAPTGIVIPRHLAATASRQCRRLHVCVRPRARALGGGRRCPAIHTVCEIIMARWGTAAHITLMIFVIMTQRECLLSQWQKSISIERAPS